MKTCPKHGCEIEVVEAVGWADTEHCPVCTAEAFLADAEEAHRKSFEALERARSRLAHAGSRYA